MINKNINVLTDVKFTIVTTLGMLGEKGVMQELYYC